MPWGVTTEKPPRARGGSWTPRSTWAAQVGRLTPSAMGSPEAPRGRLLPRRPAELLGTSRP
eukprot:4400006-Pyramimonas_sp.AAC.1